MKAVEFDERLKNVIEAYNSRDKFVFISEVAADFVNDLSDQLINLLKDLQQDKTSFEKMGISFEEKVFYDILVRVRDDYLFTYADDKCVSISLLVYTYSSAAFRHIRLPNSSPVKNFLALNSQAIHRLTPDGF